MTLKELRKKYIGKRVSEDYGEGETDIDFSCGYEYEYHATVTVDEENRISAISRMTCEELVGDDATHVTYKNCRVSADDYDLLEDYIIELLEETD